MLRLLKVDLEKIQNPSKAKILARFFKTGKGQYGEGDIFLGITVPDSRKIARKYENLTFPQIKILLKSRFHEQRLIALLILVHNFQKKPQQRGKIYDFYLKSTKFVNNWDLVDLTADKILGEYLMKKPKNILYQLARSENLWERRIAIIATYQFIKKGLFEETLKIAEILLKDKHDLIQKAVGWMLREVGKRDLKIEEVFLKKFYMEMPRTALRYAVEKFTPEKRVLFLNIRT